MFVSVRKLRKAALVKNVASVCARKDLYTAKISLISEMR